MLSEQTIQTLDDLFKVQNSYTPNSAVTAQLQEKSLFMIVGATCVGKNTVMQSVVELDGRFTIAGTFTSRKPRPSDDPNVYTYLPNTDDSLRDLFSRITAKQVVQYAVNPRGQLIYGSTIGDYTGEYNLRNVFASSVSGFEQLSFRQSIVITIISEPMAWLNRFEDRFPVGNPQRQARRDEAIESFTWSLEHAGPNHFLIENIGGDPTIAARNVIRIADGAMLDSTRARELVRLSLEAAKEIRI